MKNILFRFLYLLFCGQISLSLFALTPKQTILKPWEKGAWETGRYRNLFAEAGYNQKDIDAKLENVFKGVFEGPYKVYFEIGDSMAYISDIKNHDVRTEGMSYGMMIYRPWNHQFQSRLC